MLVPVWVSVYCGIMIDQAFTCMSSFYTKVALILLNGGIQWRRAGLHNNCFHELQKIGQKLSRTISFPVLSPYIEEMIINSLSIYDGNDAWYVRRAFRAILSLPLPGLLPYSKKILCGLCHTSYENDTLKFLNSIAELGEWKELLRVHLAEELARCIRF